MNIDGKVFVVFENAVKGGVKHIFISEELAQDAIKKSNGELMDYIESYKIEGYECRFDIPINDHCKHFNPRLNMIKELISCLYQIEGCCCGGLAHIVTDDNNYQDSHLKWVIQHAKENPNELESGLVILICEELLKLNIQQRALLFSSYYTYPPCNGNNAFCDTCKISKGEMEDDYIRFANIDKL